MSYPNKQVCPYCSDEVDSSQAEWGEGYHVVDCQRCKRVYTVTTHYKFEGFEVEKFCSDCGGPESECCHEGGAQP